MWQAHYIFFASYCGESRQFWVWHVKVWLLLNNKTWSCHVHKNKIKMRAGVCRADRNGIFLSQSKTRVVAPLVLNFYSSRKIIFRTRDLYGIHWFHQLAIWLAHCIFFASYCGESRQFWVWNWRNVKVGLWLNNKTWPCHVPKKKNVIVCRADKNCIFFSESKTRVLAPLILNFSFFEHWSFLSLVTVQGIIWVQATQEKEKRRRRRRYLGAFYSHRNFNRISLPPPQPGIHHESPWMAPRFISKFQNFNEIRLIQLYVWSGYQLSTKVASNVSTTSDTRLWAARPIQLESSNQSRFFGVIQARLTEATKPNDTTRRRTAQLLRPQIRLTITKKYEQEIWTMETIPSSTSLGSCGYFNWILCGPREFHPCSKRKRISTNVGMLLYVFCSRI